MATDTTPAPTASHPLRGLIVAELEAIKARVQSAATQEEKRVADSQFGQRIEHLEARIKEIAEGFEPETRPHDGE